MCLAFQASLANFNIKPHDRKKDEDERGDGNYYNDDLPGMLCVIHSDMLVTYAEYEADAVPAIYKADKPFEFKKSMAVFSDDA